VLATAPLRDASAADETDAAAGISISGFHVGSRNVERQDSFSESESSDADVSEPESALRMVLGDCSTFASNGATQLWQFSALDFKACKPILEAKQPS
jgi:hypothetical protein